jgi:hypothetical protein
LKNKLSWVFLIFLVLILGSCSLAREEKYSYYIEKKEEYYHNPETNLSEDVLIFTTNISVKLDENIVLKCSLPISLVMINKTTKEKSTR